jgi:polysaccharide biosynthesis transport protein
LALVVMGVVEAFNRAPPVTLTPSNTTLVLTPGWAERQASLSMQGAQAPPLLGDSRGQPLSPAMLPAPIQVLSQAEATALLTAASGASRFLCATGLMGLSIDEALAVRPRDLDAGVLQLRVDGPWSRQLPMPTWLPGAMPIAQDSDQPVLRDAMGQPLAISDVASMVISAALDAGIEHAISINWDVLRNTCIDWFVGQGLRYTDLPKLVGRIDAQMLQSLSSRHGEAKRRDLGEIDMLMPALHVDPAAPASPETGAGAAQAGRA